MDRNVRIMAKAMERAFGPAIAQTLIGGMYLALTNYADKRLSGAPYIEIRGLKFTVNDFFDFEVLPEIKVCGEPVFDSTTTV